MNFVVVVVNKLECHFEAWGVVGGQTLLEVGDLWHHAYLLELGFDVAEVLLLGF